MFRSTMLWLFAVVLAWCYVSGLDNGVGRTPPMGWLAWERFRCNTDCTDQPQDCIREELFLEMTDIMADQGYRDAGYEYVCLDDCWMDHQRDQYGQLQADPKRFPHGIKYLADYMHSRGLKLGIYADYGNQTCAGYPGTINHLKQDMETFASWGVDLLKLDACNFDAHPYIDKLPPVAENLNATGRHIVLNCKWPAEFKRQSLEVNYTLVAKGCNMARYDGDIDDSWDSVTRIINAYVDDKYNASIFAGPGFFNDPDMLIIGDYGLSYDQQRAQMAIWSMWASPLMMSVDLRNINSQSKALLLNTNAIAINQDPLGKQGRCIRTESSYGITQIWTKDILPTGSKAFVFLKLSGGGGPHLVKVTPVELGLKENEAYDVYEVFEDKYMGKLKSHDVFGQYVNPSGVFFGKMIPTNSI